MSVNDTHPRLNRKPSKNDYYPRSVRTIYQLKSIATMKITAYISRLTVVMASMVALMLPLASCNGVIYDDEGDCDVTYRLRFRYDMNMKFADAFHHEVKSVKLYAFDPQGKLVWQTADSGAHLAEEGYEIILPLPAGQYKLMAWCGLDNGESFAVPEISEGGAPEILHCKMNRSSHPEDGTVSTEDLHALFHGTLAVTLPESIDGGDFVYTMPLMKDTNVFRIVLQHLSGKDVEASDFTFKIDDNNGWLNHDNTLRDDERITYHAWSKYSGSAGVDTKGAESDFARHLAMGSLATKAITEVKVAVAELTTSRLVQRDWSVESKPMLTIRKADDGELVARIPVIDYALLVKGNYNRNMSDQEYLDRQDEYNMTFFLDENNHWLSTTVIINSWRVVLNPTDL